MKKFCASQDTNLQTIPDIFPDIPILSLWPLECIQRTNLACLLGQASNQSPRRNLMRNQILKAVFRLPGLLLLLAVTSAQAAVATPACSIADRFSNAPIAGGNYLCFSGVFRL